MSKISISSAIQNFGHKEKIIKMYDNGEALFILTSDGDIYYFENEEWIKLVSAVSCKYQDFVDAGKEFLALTTEGLLCTVNLPQRTWAPELETWMTSSLAPADKLRGVIISKIAGRKNHFLVQAQDGKLFGWSNSGRVNYELNWPSDSSCEDADEEKVISLICTSLLPMVLTKNGKIFMSAKSVFSYAENYKIRSEKLHVFGESLQNKRIMQVALGCNWMFALTDAYQIYKWKLDQLSENPEPIDIDHKKSPCKPVKMWASDQRDILVVLDKSGYLLSLCFIDDLLFTSKIPFKTVWEYFVHINVPLCGDIYSVYKEYEDNLSLEKQWKYRFEQIFNVEDGSDISFMVEEKVIYGHRTIIMAQSAYLRTMIKNWTDESPERIFIEKYTYETFYNFLTFIYTGKLDLGSLERHVELIRLAHEYDEKVLLKHCEDMAINRLTPENAPILYSLVSLLDLKDLRNACKLFIDCEAE